MTLKDLYIRVKDSTGLEVLTVSDMYTMYQNCAADLTSRGYREFAELTYTANEEDEHTFEKVTDNKYVLTLFPTAKKVLYIKIKTSLGIIKAYRRPLTDPYIDSLASGNSTRYNFSAHNNIQAIYYIKNNVCYVEYVQNVVAEEITVGLYKRIDSNIVPTSFDYLDPESGETITTTDVYQTAILETIELPIREELQDVFTLFGIYYSYNKRLKEEDMINRHLNNYKYLVEDLLHELNYEDVYNEEESVIATDNLDS